MVPQVPDWRQGSKALMKFLLLQGRDIRTKPPGSENSKQSLRQGVW